MGLLKVPLLTRQLLGRGSRPGQLGRRLDHLLLLLVIEQVLSLRRARLVVLQLEGSLVLLILQFVVHVVHLRHFARVLRTVIFRMEVLVGDLLLASLAHSARSVDFWQLHLVYSLLLVDFARFSRHLEHLGGLFGIQQVHRIALWALITLNV